MLAFFPSASARPASTQPAGQRLGWWLFLSLWLSLLALTAILLPGVAHADGKELDPTFGNGGVVQISPHTLSAQSHEVVGLVQLQNTIVAAVNLTNTIDHGNVGAMIMLLDANGKALNPPVEVATSDPSARYTSIITTSVDEFIVVGVVNGSSGQLRDFLIQRFKVNPSGNPRLTALTAPGAIGIFAGSDDVATSVWRTNSGAILVAGYSNFSGADHFSGLLLKDDGTINFTFGNNGRINDSTNLGRAYAVAVDKNGIIALGGSTGSGAAERPQLNFYTTGGTATVGSNFPDEGRITTLTVLDDSFFTKTVLLVGSQERNPDTTPHSFDATYRYYTFANALYDNANPVQRLLRPAFDESLFSIAGAANVVALAGTTQKIGESQGNFFFTRMLFSGGLADSTFGTGGITLVDVGKRIGGIDDAPEMVKAGFIQADGGILLGGYAKPQGPSDAPVGVIARLKRTAVVSQSVDKSHAQVGDTLSYRLDVTATTNLTFRITDTISAPAPVSLDNLHFSAATGMTVTQVSAQPVAWDIQLPTAHGTIWLTGTVSAPTAITPTQGVSVSNAVNYSFPGFAAAAPPVSTLVAGDFISMSATSTTSATPVADVGETLGYRIDITQSRSISDVVLVPNPQALGGPPSGDTYLNVITYTAGAGATVKTIPFTIDNTNYLFAAIYAPANHASLWVTGTVASSGPILAPGGLNVPVPLRVNTIAVGGLLVTGTVNFFVPHSAISVTESLNKASVHVGDSLSYRYVITGSPSFGFYITDTFSAGPASLSKITLKSSPGLTVYTFGTDPAIWGIILPLSHSGVLTVTGTLAASAPITQEEGVPLVNHIDYGFLGAPTAGSDTLTARLLSSKSWINLPVLLKAAQTP